MQDFIPFIIIGLATGAVYGMAGIGLVLTYKTSGIFNFGYGAIAALIAYCFYFLHVTHGLAWPYAAAVSLLVLAPLLGLGLELMARSLEGASETIKVVATVGLILIVWSLGLLWHPQAAPTFPHFLPQSTIRLLGVNLTWEEVILFLFSVAAAGTLFWFFRSVRFGILMRGVVDNQDLVAMSGDNPVLVRRWAWIIGSVFAGIAGLLLAPALLLDGVTLTTAVFAAFGAAAIGYFSNLPLTFVGGLIIGIGSALLSKYAATVPWLAGLPAALPFIILLLVLIFLPRRVLAQRRLAPVMHASQPYFAPAPVRLAAGAVAITLLALVPTIQSGHVTQWSVALIFTMLLMSLGMLVRRSGQISLCHLTFAAVGGAAFGHFAGQQHLPWLLALGLATLVAVPVGALIAIPAVRVSGMFLALATLGFGIAMEQLVYNRGIMFGDSVVGLVSPRPNISIAGLDLASDNGFYYLLLVITVLVVTFLMSLSNGRLGRLLEALANSPLALETHGASTNVVKVIVFCISSAVAALAGALYVMLFNYGSGTYFPAFNSLTLVALVVIVVNVDPWYAVLGAIGFAVVPSYISGATTSSVLNLMFGLGAITAVFALRHAGTPRPLQVFFDRIGGRKPARPVDQISGSASGGLAPPAIENAEVPPPAKSSVRGSGLEIRNLSVRYGGVRAVNDVSLMAPTGRITGLIGPNGAGKTTLFNACSGLTRPTTGRVFLHGVDVTREAPPRRARRGLGRTFQRPQLFNNLTVRQNVAMGREASMAGGNPLAQLSGSRRSNRLIDEVVNEALTITGLSRIADAQVGLLPLGQRRLAELARTLAGPFDMLLLDEPSSGLDGQETEQFGQVLTKVVRERGCGILLVEHDMILLRAVCDYVYVLDFGQQIFEGTPAEMEDSPVVRSAYLGTAELLDPAPVTEARASHE